MIEGPGGVDGAINRVLQLCELLGDDTGALNEFGAIIWDSDSALNGGVGTADCLPPCREFRAAEPNEQWLRGQPA